MAGFLRKKATLSRKVTVRDTNQPPSNFTSPVERLSSDAPPSLPPLLLSSSFAGSGPDPPALPPAASPPVLALPAAAPESLLDDAWDPWKAYADAPGAPRLDSQPARNVTQPVQNMPPSARPAPQSTRLSGPFVRTHHTMRAHFHILV